MTRSQGQKLLTFLIPRCTYIETLRDDVDTVQVNKSTLCMYCTGHVYVLKVGFNIGVLSQEGVTLDVWFRPLGGFDLALLCHAKSKWLSTWTRLLCMPEAWLPVVLGWYLVFIDCLVSCIHCLCDQIVVGWESSPL